MHRLGAVDKTAMAAINAANKILGPRFITKYGTKQGVLVLGKQVPFGVGVILGGGGNAGLAMLTARSAKKIFGALPRVWPTVPELRSDASEGVLAGN